MGPSVTPTSHPSTCPRVVRLFLPWPGSALALLRQGGRKPTAAVGPVLTTQLLCAHNLFKNHLAKGSGRSALRGGMGGEKRELKSTGFLSEVMKMSEN